MTAPNDMPTAPNDMPPARSGADAGVKTYPLIRTRLTNGRILTAMTAVLLLYSLPRFVLRPAGLVGLFLLVLFGLAVDAAAHFILYKKPVCAASAAVTVLIVYSLSPAAPMWAQLVSLAFALIVGKALWGGLGKNPLNPAMLGLVLLGFLSPQGLDVFTPSRLLIPALVLSVPFILMRPNAGIGMAVGMAAGLFLLHRLSIMSAVSAGVLFFACLVITDPVTVTAGPAAGFVLGLLAGFVPAVAGRTVMAAAAGVLAANLLSYLYDRRFPGRAEKLEKTFSGRSRVGFSPKATAFIDLTGIPDAKGVVPELSREEILARIERCGVFGFGGGAYPAAAKLRALLDTGTGDRHLIVNACECDPGLVHDKWLLTHRAVDMKKGIAILEKCVPFKSVTVAAKDLYGLTFTAPVRGVAVPDVYTAGEEKLLIRRVLGIRLRPDSIPANCGILVFNIQTVLAVYEAVVFGRPADTRYLTLDRLDTRTGTVVRARLGTDVRELAGQVFGKAGIVYAGGGVMDARPVRGGEALGERTNCLAVGHVPAFRESPCNSCSLCLAYCPARIDVRHIALLMDAGNTSKALRLHPDRCLGCGLCSYVCPAGRDQAARVKKATGAKGAGAASR